jgi:hypothetical protein
VAASARHNAIQTRFKSSSAPTVISIQCEF